MSCGIGHFARRAAPCWCSRWIDPSPAALDDAAAHTPPNCMMFRVCRVGGCLSLLSAPLSISILARLASVAHGHTKVYNVFDQHGTLSIDTGCFHGDRCRDCIASLRNGRAFDDCGVVATAHALALAAELGCHGLDRARLRPAGVPSVQP